MTDWVVPYRNDELAAKLARAAGQVTLTSYAVPLADGSVCVVERTGPTSSIVSRNVDIRCVWAQVFMRNEDHEGQVAQVIAKMQADPDAFHRWWLR